jgi:hypothetical protein
VLLLTGNGTDLYIQRVLVYMEGQAVGTLVGVGSIKVTFSLNYSRQVYKKWLYMYIRYLRTHWGQSWSGQLHKMHEIDMEFTWTVVGMANAY